MVSLWNAGYSAVDILTTIFRVVKNFEGGASGGNGGGMEEYMKLEFIREVGFTHMRAAAGVSSLLQLGGLVARLCMLKKDTTAGM